MKRDRRLERMRRADLTAAPLLPLVHGRKAESVQPAPARWKRLADLAWTLWRRVRPRHYFEHEGRHLAAAKVGR